MAISVVYTIKKIGSVEVTDIVTHTDEYWFESGNYLVTGGIREMLEKKYSPEEYKILVEVLTHPGKNDD